VFTNGTSSSTTTISENLPRLQARNPRAHRVATSTATFWSLAALESLRFPRGSCRVPRLQLGNGHIPRSHIPWSSCVMFHAACPVTTTVRARDGGSHSGHSRLPRMRPAVDWGPALRKEKQQANVTLTSRKTGWLPFTRPSWGTRGAHTVPGGWHRTPPFCGGPTAIPS